MVRKIILCLPKSKWDPKVTVIEEAQDLETIALDDPLGKLLTHKIHLKEDEEVVQTKKGIAFKTIGKGFYSSEDGPSERHGNSTTIIIRGLKMICKSKRFVPKKFCKKGSKGNERSSKGKIFLNNNESNMGPCLVMDCQGMW